MSIKEATGYRSIEKLYVQLLYQCNFSCQHCFHGELLKSTQRLTFEAFKHLAIHFHSEYDTRHIVLLGGEPFLHPDFAAMVRWCSAHGWRTETCTNGHRFVHRLLPAVKGALDLLRVSIDGLEPAHDAIRQRGSYRSALTTLDIVRRLGIPTGVTTTVTATNVSDIPELARVVAKYGASELKLHQLRMVGNALRAPQLSATTTEQLSALMGWLRRPAEHPLTVVFDDDLDPNKPADEGEQPRPDVLERIELDPAGGLTMSCKAVGRAAQAFYWSDAQRRVVYRPSDHDEIAQLIRNVNYV